MFYKKSGIPGESELVLCTVKKILFHSVFVTLDEYKNLEGMIHISEIAPGRIRNIRDYVRESKTLVCKVLKVNKERKQIDLSLRRVSLSIRKAKNAEYKQQQKAEKILELVAKELKTTLSDVYEKIGYKLMEEYESLNNSFQKILNEEIDLAKSNIPKEYAKTLTKIIKEKIKLPTVRTNQTIKLSTSAANGVTKIKDIFKKTKAFCKEKNYEVKFSYISAPKYSITLISKEHKKAEHDIKEITNFIMSTAKSNSVEGELSK